MKQGMALEILWTEIDEVALDKKSACLVLPLFNGVHGKLGLFLEHTISAFYYERQGQKLNARIFLCLALSELEHVKILRKLLIKLGIEPIDSISENYLNKSQIKSTKYLLLDGIVKEKTAISEIEKINLRLKNEKVKKVLKKIQDEEILHLEILKEQFNSNFLLHKKV